MAGTDYSVYNPPINATNYPTLFENFFIQLTTDVGDVEVLAAANAAYIAAISTTGFQLNDGVSLTLGTGSDTTISHSGTATNISHTGTGNLILTNTSNSITVGDTLTSFSDNISASGNIALVVDNATLDIGASADLSLKHSGIASYITNNTGYLYIDNLDSASYTFLSSGTTPCVSVGGPNNSANLLYGGASKLITTTAGIEVTGDISVNGAPILREKVLEIGVWDMTATSTVPVTHGITNAISRVRGVSIIILNDNESASYDFNSFISTDTGKTVSIGGTTIVIARNIAGFFNSTNFDTKTVGTNRGWILIKYTA